MEANRRATSRDSNTLSRRSVDRLPALAIFAACVGCGERRGSLARRVDGHVDGVEATGDAIDATTSRSSSFSALSQHIGREFLVADFLESRVDLGLLDEQLVAAELRFGAVRQASKNAAEL